MAEICEPLLIVRMYSSLPDGDCGGGDRTINDDTGKCFVG